MLAKIKKGDLVIVLSGSDRGVTGSVLKIFPASGGRSKCLVSGVNVKVKFDKKQRKMISRECPVYISKVALTDKSGNIVKIKRVGVLDGKRVSGRFSKFSDELVG